MDNHLLVAELKAAGPGAVKAIHDSYASGLFQYCWFVLRNSDAAQVALRDTLIAAQAHIGRLADPDLLKPWLYALARVECLRRNPSPASDPDVQRAGAEELRPDPILTAWHAVMDLGPLEREALELSSRHSLEPRGVASVLGIATRESELLLIRARESLAQALAGEILASTGRGGCRDLAAMMTGYDGTTTAPLRERLVSHAGRCAACGQHLPRNVSAAKVYGLLPVAEFPLGMRARALSCCNDPALSGYRAFVAGRAARFGHDGFPFSPAAAVAAAAAAPARRRTSAHLWVGLAAAIAATALGAGFALSRMGGYENMMRRILPGPAGPLRYGAVVTSAPNSRLQAGRPITPAIPLGAASAESGAVRPLPPFPAAQAQQPLRGTQAPLPAGRLLLSSGRLDLGTMSSGRLVLSAIGGSVAWSASTSSADLALRSYAGWLPRGGTATLVVTVARNGRTPSRGAVIIGPGNLSVLATWIAPSLSPSLSSSRSWPASPAPASLKSVPPSAPVHTPSAGPAGSPSRSPSRAPSRRSSRQPVPAPPLRSVRPATAHPPASPATRYTSQRLAVNDVQPGGLEALEPADLESGRTGYREPAEPDWPQSWQPDEAQPDLRDQWQPDQWDRGEQDQPQLDQWERWQPDQAWRWQPGHGWPWQPDQGWPWQPSRWRQWRHYLPLPWR